MNWDLKTIGIVVAIFFIGYIIGLVEAAIKQRTKGKKKTDQERTETTEITPAPVSDPDLIKFNRDKNGSLVVEMEGQTFANKQGMTAENRRSLTNLLVELRPWLETGSLVTPPPEGQTRSEPEPVQTSNIPPVKPSSPIPVEPEKPATVVNSMVYQINEILQTRLVGTNLAGLGIRLLESTTGSVLVYIGLQKYEGIDSVPDPDIKAIIRQSVSDWEKKA